MPQEAPPAELKARLATYAQLASAPDKKNLPFLRTALRTERDPLLRVALADALYRSDPEQGGGALLEALPASPDLFLRLRNATKEQSLPVPAVASLLDLAVDGSAEAMLRLLALCPLAQVPPGDEALASMLTGGLVEVGEASPDELVAALRIVPAPQAQAAVELISQGLLQAETDAQRYPLAEALRVARGAPFDGWLSVLEHRKPVTPPQPQMPAQAAPARPAAVASKAAEPASFDATRAGAKAVAPKPSAPSGEAYRAVPAVLIAPESQALPSQKAAPALNPARVQDAAQNASAPPNAGGARVPATPPQACVSTQAGCQ